MFIFYTKLKNTAYIFLSLLCFLLFHFSFAQTIISGKIVDENNTPLPYVHIRVENTNLGTISNKEGLFRLVFDAWNEKKEIVISTIGYQTKKFFLKEGYHILSLVPEITELKGITLTPIDYGRELIHKAIKAIPNNYPLIEERHMGFLREKTNWKDESKPIYIVEAVMESIKKTYLKRQLSGDVKLNEFRKYESGQLDSLHLRIYGGSHDIHSFDFVARRKAFLRRPNNFTYKIKDTLKQNDKDVYHIYFENNEGQSGNVYVMDSSFAIIKVNIRDVSTVSLLNISPYRRKYRNLTITYEQGDDNLWRYKHSHYETAFDKKGEILELTSDYVTTEVVPNTLDIPYLERSQFQDILLDAPKHYSKEFWDDYNIILPDERVERLFQSINPSNNKQNESQSNLFDFLHRFKSEMMLVWEPININPFSVSYENTAIEIQENGSSSKRNAWGISTSLLYEIRPDLFVGYANKSKITRFGIISHDFVVSKKINLNPNGRPIFISTDVKLGYQELYSFIDSYKSTEDFFVKGKDFDSGKIDVSLSQRNFHVQPNITFGVEKSHRLNFIVSIGYNFQFKEKTGLVFLEKDKFFLFRKKTFLKNGEENLKTKNEELLENKLNFGFGLVYKL
ncbi:carboxypeptidase-like regulatory domain-containing protein [Muricauda sp. NFXS6]|uniref:carboxypeptidase-like regulatory domain-containing protein n=1 Tax=Allomuricauda sp. NFXS6 TaxID=2819094 RepID=UPI0032DE4AEA